MSSITLVTFLKIQYKGASIYDRLNYQNGKRDDFAPLDDGSGDYTNTSPENIIPYSMPEPYSSTQNYYYLPFIYQGAAKNKTGDNLEAALFLANNALAMNKAREAVAYRAKVKVAVVKVNSVTLAPERELTVDQWIASSMTYDTTTIEIILSSAIDAVGQNAPNLVLSSESVGALPSTASIQNV